MPLPSVSVCFPAYNEELTIGEVLVDAHTLLSRAGLDYEILVCDDGSIDQTAVIVDNLSQRLTGIRVIRHHRNLGIHATFEDLYAQASKEFVFLNSTDKQWRTAILLDLLPLGRDWDVIVASRKNKHYGVFRWFVSCMFNMMPVLLFRVRTFDAGSVKLMRREIIERFTLVSRSPFSEAERLIRAGLAGYRITECPVEISRRQTGRARGSEFGILLESVADVFRVWWALRGKSPRRNALS